MKMHYLLTLKYFRNMVFGMAVLLTPILSLAQNSYMHGKPVYPAFEGWRENPDGSFNFMFGYFNENWEQAPLIEIGEDNFISPGDADQGQPTNFFPRRNRFVFEVTVPSDWGDRELVWTLKVNGEEHKAFATLNPNYVVDNLLIASETGSLGIGTSSPESRANEPPVLTVEGDAVRSARVGESITIRSRVLDDGIPRARPVRPLNEEALQRRMLAPASKPTVGKINGLWTSWNIYRGPADGVSFDPPQTKVWEDTRFGANSPWAVVWAPPEIPEDGMIEVTATFEKPGTYILWGRADDGGLYHDAYLTVNVSP